MRKQTKQKPVGTAPKKAVKTQVKPATKSDALTIVAPLPKPVSKRAYGDGHGTSLPPVENRPRVAIALSSNAAQRRVWQAEIKTLKKAIKKAKKDARDAARAIYREFLQHEREHIKLCKIYEKERAALTCRHTKAQTADRRTVADCERRINILTGRLSS